MALVCLCNRVNDRTVARAIRKGADTVDAVGAACGAGARCGGCRPTIDDMLACAEASEPLLVGLSFPARAAS